MASWDSREPWKSRTRRFYSTTVTSCSSPSEDFSGCPEAVDDGCTLGLISQTKSVRWTPGEARVEKTCIEFYHKLAQEHCAAMYLAKRYEQAYRFTRFFKMSKVDKVLRAIQKNIGEYEHLIRFLGGRSTALCIRVMGSILATRAISKRERYRILLDCSSSHQICQALFHLSSVDVSEAVPWILGRQPSTQPLEWRTCQKPYKKK